MIHLIGKTPMIQLNNIPTTFGFKGTILAKCEYMNPTGSATDQVVKHALARASQNSLMQRDTIILEKQMDLCLSVAWISGICDLKPTMILENSIGFGMDLLQATKARIVLSSSKNRDEQPIYNKESLNPLTKSLYQMIPTAQMISSEITTSSILCHYSTIGTEIESIHRKIDILVCGAEAGGMIFGITMRLREKADDDPMISIGVDFRDNRFCKNHIKECEIPDSTISKTEELKLTQTVFRNHAVTRWYKASNADSYLMARRIAKEEGLLVDPTSGAILFVAMKAIEDFGFKETNDAVVAVVFNRPLWTSSHDFIYNPWMINNQYFLDIEMESIYWWWDQPISTLSLQPLLLLSAIMTVEIAMNVLEKADEPRGIILDSSNQPIGVLTLATLKFLLDQNLITITDTLIKSSCSSYKKMYPVERVAELHHVLQDVPYILVVQKNLNMIGEDQEKVLGLLDQGNLMKYQLKIEKHHADNYGLVLCDGIPTQEFLKTSLSDGTENPLTSKR